MGWVGWIVIGALITMGVLTVAGAAIAVVRGVRLRRRIAQTSVIVTPLTSGIAAVVDDIGTGVARAQTAAANLSSKIEELRVPLAELRVIGRYASVAFTGIRGPLGWIAGIRALIKYRGL